MVPNLGVCGRICKAVVVCHHQSSFKAFLQISKVLKKKESLSETRKQGKKQGKVTQGK